MPRLIVPSSGGGTKLMRTLRAGEGDGVGDVCGEGVVVGDSCAAATVPSSNSATIGNRQSAIGIFKCNSASSHLRKDCPATRNRPETLDRHLHSRRTDRAIGRNDQDDLACAWSRIRGPF